MEEGKSPLYDLLKKKEKDLRLHDAKLHRLETRYVDLTKQVKNLQNEKRVFVIFLEEFGFVSATDETFDFSEKLDRLRVWMRIALEDRRTLELVVRMIFPSDTTLAAACDDHSSAFNFDVLRDKWIAYEQLYNDSIGAIQAAARDTLMASERKLMAAAEEQRRSDDTVKQLQDQLRAVNQEKAKLILASMDAQINSSQPPTLGRGGRLSSRPGGGEDLHYSPTARQLLSNAYDSSHVDDDMSKTKSEQPLVDTPTSPAPQLYVQSEYTQPRRSSSSDPITTFKDTYLHSHCSSRSSSGQPALTAPTTASLTSRSLLDTHPLVALPDPYCNRQGVTYSTSPSECNSQADERYRRTAPQDSTVEPNERLTKLQAVVDSLRAELDSSRRQAKDMLRTRDITIEKLRTRLLNLEQTDATEDCLMKFAEKQASRELLVSEMQSKIAELKHMLVEAEAITERERSQCQLLKGYVRDLERSGSRQHVSQDYLKNVVVKYLEFVKQGDCNGANCLVPVISRLLHLDPTERRRVSSTLL